MQVLAVRVGFRGSAGTEAIEMKALELKCNQGSVKDDRKIERLKKKPQQRKVSQ